MAYLILKNKADFPLNGNARERGRLTTSSTVVDQVILNYRVRAGEILNIKAFAFKARLATYATTPQVLGNWSILVGTNRILTLPATNETRQLPPPLNYQVTEFFDEPPIYLLQDPIPVPPGTALRFVCTPASSTNMIWIAKFIGDER